MVKLIARWFLLAAALLLVAYLYPGVIVSSFGAAMIAAFVLGLLNTVVRPLLVLLTLPVTLLTLGLFLFVINALMFWAAASLLDGFDVRDFWAALIGDLQPLRHGHRRRRRAPVQPRLSATALLTAAALAAPARRESRPSGPGAVRSNRAGASR
jgi:putative membrane protein